MLSETQIARKERLERKEQRKQNQIEATSLWKSGYSIDELGPLFGKDRMTILGWIRKVNGNAERTPEEKELALERKEIKRKGTLLDRYGVTATMSCPAILEKSRQTNLDRYGVTSACKSPSVIERRRLNCIKKYGVDSPMKIPEIAKRCNSNRKQTKYYTFASGGSLRTQGHGDLALRLLEKLGFEASDLLTEFYSDVRYPNQDTGGSSAHIFDILIVDLNLVIEVKGTHPKYGWPADKDRALVKMQASLAAGYDYQIWVFSDKDKLDIYV